MTPSVRVCVCQGGVVDEITDPSLCVVNPQLNAEVHHCSKKGQGGVSFLTGLKNKCTKLLSDIEDFENHEEIINNNLEDIKAGGRTLFNRAMPMTCSASHSWKFNFCASHIKKTFVLFHSNGRHPH